MGLYEKSCLFPECKLSKCRDTGDLSWRKQCLQKLKWKILRQEKLVLSLAQNLGPLLRESLTPRWERKPPGWVRQLRENKCVQGEGMTWERRLWDGYYLGSVPKRHVFPASSCHHTPPLSRVLHFFIHLLNYTFFHLLTCSFIQYLPCAKYCLSSRGGIGHGPCPPGLTAQVEEVDATQHGPCHGGVSR